MLVKAGAAVDELIEQLAAAAEAGRHPHRRRQQPVHRHDPSRAAGRRRKGLLYVGSGVSGGEEGALHGPSLMPGGSAAAWPHIRPIFQAICARTPEGEPCCDWMGEDGAGHFVKMVHNGIEYGDMQLICETYDLMKRGLGLSNDANAPGVRRVERGRTRQLPDRDHARHPRLPRRRRRGGHRPDPRRRRPEGHRQVDRRTLRWTRACRSR